MGTPLLRAVAACAALTVCAAQAANDRPSRAGRSAALPPVACDRAHREHRRRGLQRPLRIHEAGPMSSAWKTTSTPSTFPAPYGLQVTGIVVNMWQGGRHGRIGQRGLEPVRLQPAWPVGTRTRTRFAGGAAGQAAVRRLHAAGRRHVCLVDQQHQREPQPRSRSAGYTFGLHRRLHTAGAGAGHICPAAGRARPRRRPRAPAPWRSSRGLFHSYNPTKAKPSSVSGLYIIQHPNGEPKQLVLRNNELVDTPNQFVAYVADTSPGSSGSPVYNDQWEVVALHHALQTCASQGRQHPEPRRVIVGSGHG